MSNPIVVEEKSGTPIEQARTEIVERKGIGHPDSLADGIAETVSRRLCQRYEEKFGAIAHHNTDEVQIIGGQSRPALGGGTVMEPIYILLGGRATRELDGNRINVHGTALQAAREYLRDNVANLDIEQDVILDSRIGIGSTDLTDVFDRDSQIPLSNDTSFGVGHAPFSETEKVVSAVEAKLNSDDVKQQYPFIGEDIKVMAHRNHDTITLTVAVAYVDRYVDSVEQYEQYRETLREIITATAKNHTDRALKVAVNTADGETADSLYLTVTGTSAEMGDDGSVGRGNRVSGLITPHRAMSLEASSGKNPVSHIGKLYNVMSHRIAAQIADELAVEEAHIALLSQIGKRIDQPQTANVQLVAEDELTPALRSSAQAIVENTLNNADRVLSDIVDGNVRTF